MAVGGGNHDGARFMVSVSEPIRQVIKLVDNVAQSDCCVLLEGESGTGKELLARRLHAKSRRKYRPFIPVNCTGISASLFESQFFGHIRGAFTGAEQDTAGVVRTASGGTVLLDEISEMSAELQPKLLRVIEEQEVMPVGQAVPEQVDTRFIAATNRNLSQLVRQGEFREDLYHRLNIVRITVPPLRNRLEALPAMLEHFSLRSARRYNCQRIEIDRRVCALLMQYSWPGNVRELAAWVERLYATELEPLALGEMLLEERDDTVQVFPPSEGLSLEQLERRAIVEAMDRADSNQREAARILNIHRATLARKLKKYRLA